MLQLGWKAGTEQYSPGELLEYAVVAEEAGFDSIDVSDDFILGAKKVRRASSGHGWERRRLKHVR